VKLFALAVASGRFATGAESPGYPCAALLLVGEELVSQAVDSGADAARCLEYRGLRSSCDRKSIMNGNLESTPDIETLATCRRCRQLWKLVDVSEEATEAGLIWQGPTPAFVLECCGYTLSIDDDKIMDKVIEFIQLHRPQGS